MPTTNPPTLRATVERVAALFKSGPASEFERAAYALDWDALVAALADREGETADEVRKLRARLSGVRAAHGSSDDCNAESGECGICGALDCEGGEPLHYHHDGCPYEYLLEREVADLKDEVAATVERCAVRVDELETAVREELVHAGRMGAGTRNHKMSRATAFFDAANEIRALALPAPPVPTE